MPSVCYKNSTHVILIKGGGNVTSELSHPYIFQYMYGEAGIIGSPCGELRAFRRDASSGGSATGLACPCRPHASIFLESVQLRLLA